MSAEQQRFPEFDDTQEIDMTAIFSLEEQDDLLNGARISQFIAYDLQRQIRDLSLRGENIPPYLHQMSREAAAAAGEQLSRRSKVALQEHHRTHPSLLKRFSIWLGGIANRSH